MQFSLADVSDAAAIAAVRNRAAERLTREFGGGHWSSLCTERGVAQGLRTSRVVVARDGSAILATLRLLTKKPWAIDRRFFSPSRRPVYLVDMAVDPAHQRQGVGRALIEEARRVARAWPGDSLCLDAYDAPAGAGGFYARCGFREVGRATYRATPLIYFEHLLGALTLPKSWNLLFLLLLGACQPRAAQDARAAGIAIGRANAGLSRWIAAGDLDSLAAVYADSAWLFPINGPPVIGRKAVRGHWATALGWGSWQFVPASDEVVVEGNVAVERGHYSLLFSAGPAAPTGVTSSADHGHYLTYWRKGPDATWRITWTAQVSEVPPTIDVTP